MWWCGRLLMRRCCLRQHQTIYVIFFFFFNDTATTEIYTLSLHDALPISVRMVSGDTTPALHSLSKRRDPRAGLFASRASAEIGEHTSELQSRPHLVCRLLLEKKKNKTTEALAPI